MIAILLATLFHGSDTTTEILSLLWQEYSYQTWSSIAEFSYLTISVLSLKLLLRAIHWNSEHFSYIWLVYKTSSYTVIYQSDNDNFYWTWFLVFNSDILNQYSLPSQTSSTHLKLQPHNRQMVQHISWSQGCSNKSVSLSLLYRVSIL